MSLLPGTRLGPYEILAAIGAGGMGEVYKARDTRLDRSVAIKVLPAHVSADPERRARFEREAKTIRDPAISSPTAGDGGIGRALRSRGITTTTDGVTIA